MVVLCIFASAGLASAQDSTAISDTTARLLPTCIPDATEMVFSKLKGSFIEQWKIEIEIDWESLGFETAIDGDKKTLKINKKLVDAVADALLKADQAFRKLEKVGLLPKFAWIQVTDTGPGRWDYAVFDPDDQLLILRFYSTWWNEAVMFLPHKIETNKVFDMMKEELSE